MIDAASLLATKCIDIILSSCSSSVLHLDWLRHLATGYSLTYHCFLYRYILPCKLLLLTMILMDKIKFASSGQCPLWQYKPTTYCKECPKGKQQDANDLTKCVPCLAGKIRGRGGTDDVACYDAGSTDPSKPGCTAWEYALNGYCTECGTGKQHDSDWAKCELCPAGKIPGYYSDARTGQCLPKIERLLPLRSLALSAATKPRHVLLDKRSDTYLATSPIRRTTLRANLGKDYLVQSVRLSYRNLSSTQKVRVLVYDSNGRQVGAGYFKPRKAGSLVLRLKEPSSGNVPIGGNFNIVIPKSRVRVSDVSFWGGSTFTEASSRRKISWGLAVVVDFANSKLEDYIADQNSTAIHNVQDIRKRLDLMESHWLWMSRGVHQVEWVIERVTLDQRLAPNAFDNSWITFREAVATKIRNKVRLSDYDSNLDEILDHAWLILAAKNTEPEGPFWYMVGGRSMHNNVDIFADGQGGLAVNVSCTGCFNHEVAHTKVFDLGDLYGDFSNLGGLSLMSYPWGESPEHRIGLLGFDMMKVGWSQPLVFNEDAVTGGFGIVLKPMEDPDGQAVLLKAGDNDNEYFMLEYRKRVASWLDIDGIIITHVVASKWNTTGNRAEPPLIQVEAADGLLQYNAEWPTANSFWYPENENMPKAFIGRLYGQAKGFVNVTDFHRLHRENAIAVTVYFGEFQ